MADHDRPRRQRATVTLDEPQPVAAAPRAECSECAIKDARLTSLASELVEARAALRAMLARRS